MDVNGDGSLDIVVTQFMNSPATTNTPIVYTNDGAGHFDVALRAGELNTFSANDYFIGVFTVPVKTALGMALTNISMQGTTTYETTLLPIKALPGPVTITGTAHADQIRQSSADNAIDGGAGLDTVVYNGKAANYAITAKDGSFQVVDQTGADGSDVLVNVERLTFADAAIALDVSGTGGRAYRLYQAAFNRAPDAGGLGFQMWAMDSVGFSLNQVAQGFIDSPEFKTTYGNLSNKDFVTQLYANVLHRAPDAGGLKFHVDLLDAGTISRAQDLVGFSESPENQAALIGVIGNGFVYIPH